MNYQFNSLEKDIKKKLRVVSKWTKHQYKNYYFQYVYERVNVLDHYKFSVCAKVWRMKLHSKRWHYSVRYKNIPHYQSISGYCMSKVKAMAVVDEFLKRKKIRFVNRSKKEFNERLQILK
jgi:hypothetical protein